MFSCENLDSSFCHVFGNHPWLFNVTQGQKGQEEPNTTEDCSRAGMLNPQPRGHMQPGTACTVTAPAQYHHAVALTCRVTQPGSQAVMCYEPYLSWNQGTGRALWLLIQVMANNFRHFLILPEHNPVNSKKCAAVLSILMKEFENWFQDCKKIISFSVYLWLHFQSI